MRSITQTIILDRLQHALVSRGVDLKRSAVLEIAAQAFGYLDGNAFTAAMKEGTFDPPLAEDVGSVDVGGTTLTILRDPTDGAMHAFDRARLDEGTRRNQFAVSPYGRILGLTGRPTVKEAVEIGAPKRKGGSREIMIVGDVLQGGGDADTRRYRRLLSDDTIDVGNNPILYLSATRMAYVDGTLHFLFDFEEEYEDHEQGVLAARSFAAFETENAAMFEALGGFVAWQDRFEHGRIEFQAYLPAAIADDVDSIEDWHDAVAILFGADHEQATARFHPQKWVKDEALDDAPPGDVDYDVSFEVLLMGSRKARAVRDNSDASDGLKTAVGAPDWIRTWDGPHYVTVADDIASYLDERALNAESRSDDEDWACDQCGETLQDGSGVCITCGHDHNVADDGECHVCEERIDYDTGICTGCGHDHNADEPANTADARVLRTVLPDDAAHLMRTTDGNDTV